MPHLLKHGMAGGAGMGPVWRVVAVARQASLAQARYARFRKGTVRQAGLVLVRSGLLRLGQAGMALSGLAG